MGCDIHLWVESKNRSGEWKYVRDPNDEHAKYREPGDPPTGLSYHRRNYDLFAILAGVRNGVGFAGVKMGEGFEPIAEPRGVPRNASVEYKKHKVRWGVDGHSHSHVTLAEILGTDWGAKHTVHYGVITWQQFADRVRNKEAGSPKGDYCGDVMGANVRVVSEADALQLRACDVAAPPSHVRISWRSSYRESIQHFLDWVAARVVPLGKPDDVRFVFFFDN